METTAYRTIEAPVRSRLTDRRSVFECRLERVADEAAARATVESARSEHWDARHHCSAFVIGPGGGLARSSDDGEPAGTAGMPMLDVLTGAGLSDVVAVVTRWFGGVLLGSGGLVRAYSGAVRQAVQEAVPVRRELRWLASATLDHAEAGRVEHALRQAGLTVQGVDYADRAVVRLVVAPGGVGAAEAVLAQACGGEVPLSLDDRVWVDVPR